MIETRGVKYGRNLAIWINHTIQSIPYDSRKDYRTRLKKELKNYSLVPHRKGEPRNSGCNFELENIDRIDVSNPKQLARLIKEGIHLMYQKQTAEKVLTSLLENL
jgi:hypothetical protein